MIYLWVSILYRLVHAYGSVTYALMIYLICIPSALRPVNIGLWGYISGKSLVPVLQLLATKLRQKTFRVTLYTGSAIKDEHTTFI